MRGRPVRSRWLRRPTTTDTSPCPRFLSELGRHVGRGGRIWTWCTFHSAGPGGFGPPHVMAARLASSGSAVSQETSNPLVEAIEGPSHPLASRMPCGAGGGSRWCGRPRRPRSDRTAAMNHVSNSRCASATMISMSARTACALRRRSGPRVPGPSSSQSSRISTVPSS